MNKFPSPTPQNCGVFFSSMERIGYKLKKIKDTFHLNEICKFCYITFHSTAPCIIEIPMLHTPGLLCAYAFVYVGIISILISWELGKLCVRLKKGSEKGWLSYCKHPEKIKQHIFLNWSLFLNYFPPLIFKYTY